MNWFRLPVFIITADSDVRAAWVWLLGSWHIGAKPGINDLRRQTGWGGGRATKFMAEAREWAEANGAVVHKTTHRNDTGTEAEQQRNETGTQEHRNNHNNSSGTEQDRNSSGTEPERNRNASRARVSSEIRETSDTERDHVPPVPVATLSQSNQEPPACAPPPSIQASAPESTGKDATNIQLGLYGQATASTADIPKKQKKPTAKVDKSEDIRRVWSCFRQWHPLCKEEVPKGDGEQISICLNSWTADEIMEVVTWAHTSSHKDAVWLRENDRTGIKTLTVQASFSQRLELARRTSMAKLPTRPHQTPEPVVPPEDPAAIWDEMIRIRSQGIRVCPDHISLRTKDALRAAGGWNQLGLLNDFTEKQARNAFITAYRNNTPNDGHPRNA